MPALIDCTPAVRSANLEENTAPRVLRDHILGDKTFVYILPLNESAERIDPFREEMCDIALEM